MESDTIIMVIASIRVIGHKRVYICFVIKN